MGDNLVFLVYFILLVAYLSLLLPRDNGEKSNWSVNYSKPKKRGEESIKAKPTRACARVRDLFETTR